MEIFDKKLHPNWWKFSLEFSNIWCNLRKNTCQRRCLYLRFLMTAAAGLFKLYLAVTLLLNPLSVSPFRIGGAMPTVFSYFSEVLAREKRGEHLSWLCMFWMIGGIYASAMAWAIIPHYGKRSHRRKKNLLVIWRYSSMKLKILKLDSLKKRLNIYSWTNDLTDKSNFIIILYIVYSILLYIVVVIIKYLLILLFNNSFWRV